MIRTKGEAGTGNVIEAVRHLKLIKGQIAALKSMTTAQLKAFAKAERVPLDLVLDARKAQRLPVVTFVAGGVATPADAALLMELGAEGVFVGSGIFKSKDPKRMARAMVAATTYYRDPKKVMEVSTGLGAAMAGLEIGGLQTRMQEKGV